MDESTPSSAMRALCFLGAFIVIALLFQQASNPDAVNLIPPPWDKLAHFAVYSTITALLWFGTGGRMPIALLAIVALTGAFDELHQGAIPGRVADGWDFIADFTASVTTALVLPVLFGTRRARSTP